MYKLKFNVAGVGGVLNVLNKPTIYWEVCNAGQNSDDEHHEIYYKGANEADGDCYFSRILAYKGTHLLRCRVIDKKKKFDETVVFVVYGV